ncbi:hypothetical protein ACM43_11230 [Bradyrhizobium sp. CCBAU 45321]|nr:hypothetical protein [Bradyrhizobium sp. CCBAU 45321]
MVIAAILVFATILSTSGFLFVQDTGPGRVTKRDALSVLPYPSVLRAIGKTCRQLGPYRVRGFIFGRLTKLNALGDVLGEEMAAR